MEKRLDIKLKVNMRKTALILSEFLIIFLITCSSISAADYLKPGLAPENPDFINYQNTIESAQKVSTQKQLSVDGYKTCIIIPPPVNLHQQGYNSPAYVSYPDYYDLRALNRVTTVKDQGSAGACWVFATYGSLESCLMTGENRDFSENNMKNLLSSAYSEGFDRSSTDGGNNFMSTAYLARWSGPVDESADPYRDTSTSSPTGLSIQKHVQNVLFLPDRQGSLDNQEIKYAVQNYGAVYTSMYYDNGYYSPTNCSYCYSGSSSYNHAVAIVGWNDSFDRNSFSSVPPWDGAFIVKNSWGTGWGDKGYFYVSYYDLKIGKYNAVFTAENPNNYKYVYQYDPLGWINSFGYSNPTCWCANIFTAKSEEILKAVSFYTTDSNCNYEIYVYTNPESGPINKAGLVLNQNGTISTAGYHTVNLDSGAQLSAGQKFSVVVKLTTPNYNYPIAIEMPISRYSSKAKANLKESFVSKDGNDWTDIINLFSNTNVCIKAFTDPGNNRPVTNFTSNVTQGYVPLSVQFTDLSINATGWNWDFGDKANSTSQNATHTYSTVGTYTVKLNTSNQYGSSTKQATITVKATPVVANFTSNVTSGYVPLSVQFIDHSINTTRWFWDFGDKTNSTSQNATHTYSAVGTYTVKLNASNQYGSNIKQTTIKVNAISVKANFTSNTSSSLNVQFTDLSTNATSWSWDFGDRTNSTSQNPIHTYSAVGTYAVKLNASNQYGSNIKQATITFPTIYGYCFNDTNKNGYKDTGEVGIPKMAVKLYGYDTLKKMAFSTTMITNSIGYYGFNNINPGFYIASEGFANGWLPTYLGAYTVAVNANSTGYEKDFGNNMLN